MAPFPQNNTGRYVVSYLANGREHSAMFRFAGASPSEAFTDRVDEFLQACQWGMPEDWAILGAVFYPTGVNFSQPAITPSAVVGAVDPVPAEAPGFMSIVGRGVSGRRTRLYLLGWAITPANEVGNASDYRITRAERTEVATMLDAADIIPSVTIFGDTPIWNQYINLGYNSYWQRELRG